VADFLPAGDQEFLNFGLNYSSVITAGPVALGLTTAIATELASRTSTYQTKLLALNTPANKNPVVRLEKDQAKADLEEYIRETARVIQACMTVTDVQREELRLPIRDTTRTPVDPITDAPLLTILKIFGHNVTVRVRDISGTRRGKPSNARGCMIYSYVGTTPPEDYRQWASEGVITRDSVIVAMPTTLAVGTKCYITACWYNTRGAGPACTPAAFVIGAEGASAA
jgi:hypothetical protein